MKGARQAKRMEMLWWIHNFFRHGLHVLDSCSSLRAVARGASEREDYKREVEALTEVNARLRAALTSSNASERAKYEPVVEALSGAPHGTRN